MVALWNRTDHYIFNLLFVLLLSPKITIWAPSHNFVGLYIFATKARIDNRKKLVKQQYTSAY